MRRFFLTAFILLWLASYSFANISVAGSLSHEKTAQPGTIYEGVIELNNPDKVSSEVKIYATDYLFYADGRNIYGLPGTNPLSNAEWITLSEQRATVPPQNKVPVHYTVKVPQDQNLKGTYWSMVMIEPVKKAGISGTTPKKNRTTLGVSVQIRYGVQLITNIGNTGARKIKFSNMKLFGDGKDKIFRFDVENIGERGLSPSVTVQLYSAEGKSLGRYNGKTLRIFPGCSVRQEIILGNMPKGNYKALVIADNGDEYVFGAQYDLKVGQK
ncbi:MAG: hypothetical protein ACM3WV_09495 [Bacillota bacterium]